MPKIKQMIPETASTITRPIVLEVVRQIMDMTGIDKETTQIFFPRENGRIAQVGSTLTGDALPNITNAVERVKIEASEDYQAEEIGSVAVHQPENRLIFLDNDLDTVVRPVYVTSTMTINFSYRAVDQTSAERWRDEIAVRMSMMDHPHLLNLTYSYVIPEYFLIILQEIHRLREATDGYKQDWPTYFNDNSSKLLSVLSNLAGKEQVLALSETQTRVPGMFDFEAVPEKGNREDGTEAWTITFSYKFQYAKAVACQMTYPIVVHNQPLNELFLPKVPDTPNNHKVSMSASMYGLAHFESGSWSHPEHYRDGYAIPPFDDFIPDYQLPATKRVVTSLVLIDEARPEVLMNLGDIDSAFAFKPEVLAFLREETPSLTKPYMSIFNVSLYRNVHMLPPEAIEVRPNMDVVVTKLKSLRYYYHVRLSMVTDLRRVDMDGLDRARRHGKALVEILKAIEPSLEERGLLPRVLKNNYVTRADLEAVIREMERGIRRTDETTIKQFNTVQTLFVKVSDNAGL